MSLDAVVNPKLVQAAIDCLVKGVVECDRISGKQDSPVEAEHIDAYRAEYNRALRSGSFRDALREYFKNIIPLILRNSGNKEHDKAFDLAKTLAGGIIVFGGLTALSGRPPPNDCIAVMAVGGVAYCAIDFIQKYFGIASRRAWNRRCNRVLSSDTSTWQATVEKLYKNREAYESFREWQNV